MKQFTRYARQNSGHEAEKYQAYLCSREWSILKEAVRERAGGMCERCFVNPMQACHHLTYIRKYEERLSDLQAICDDCHSYTHGKSSSDKREIGLSVYLAGKISNQNSWRHKYLSQWMVHSEIDNEWEVIKNGVQVRPNGGAVYLFDYCGPFFISTGGHGQIDDGENCHGRGEELSIETCRDTFTKCVKAIQKCDVFVAWIDSTDCHGTLAEIGIAWALGKTMLLAYPHPQSQIVNLMDIWFARMCFTTTATSVEDVLMKFIKQRARSVDLSNLCQRR